MREQWKSDQSSSVLICKYLYNILFLHGCSGALDFFEDHLALGLPNVTLGTKISVFKIALDGSNQLSSAEEAAVTDAVNSQVPEKALHEIHPRTGSGREVKVDAAGSQAPFLDSVARSDPLHDHGLLVSGIVIDNQVKGEIRRSFPVELFQEPEPFLMRVLGGRLAEDFAVKIVQGREKGDRAMPDVIMSARADLPRPQGQRGLRALQCLALTFLVAAKHQRALRRIQIQADHIPKFFLEPWII